MYIIESFIFNVNEDAHAFRITKIYFESKM